MRFVARLAIVIVTLVGAAVHCWGQTPSRDGSAFAVSPASAYRPSTPLLTPPATAEGTWVSDDQPLAGPAEMYDAQELTGMSDYGASPYEYGFDPSQGGSSCSDGFGDGYGNECGDGSCDQFGDPAAGCGGLFGHRLGGWLHGACACEQDLWSDVHAHHRVYFQADYLSMWAKGNPLPPLVTTSPIGTPQSQAGVLPVSATTSILYGNERVDLDQRNGGRINVGYWLVDGEFLGIEGQYFALQTQNSNFNSSDPILARPFLNVDPSLPSPTQDAALVSFPDYQIGGVTTDLDGTINVHTVSNIQSANMTLRRLVWIDFTMQRRVDLLLGYRFFRLDDSVTVDDASTIQPAGIIPLTMLTSQDLWRSRNQFNGGEIGLKAQSYRGPVVLEFIGKCAFGNNRERTWINGYHTTTVNGVTTTGTGGLLTQQTNIGSYRRDVFAILPEADFNLKLDVTCHARLVLGYTFIYMNRVQRSGDAIDTTLNPTQIGGALTGPARPAFFATDSTFWVHGFNAGLEYRW